jgi:hypothetical protein
MDMKYHLHKSMDRKYARGIIHLKTDRLNSEHPEG